MLDHDVFYDRERPGKEELASYLPKYWNEIKEMRANNTFAGYTLDRMAADMEQTVRDRFFDTCSESALADFEAFLHIVPEKGVSIESRRKTVKMRWNGDGKMTGSRIKAIVEERYGCECEVIFGASQLEVNMIFHEDPPKYTEIRNLFAESTIPAHIEIVYKGKQEAEEIKGNINIGHGIATFINGPITYVHGLEDERDV